MAARLGECPPRAWRPRFHPLLLLYFAETGCHTLTLRRVFAPASLPTAQGQGGGIRLGEVKEEVQPSGRAGDIRRDGYPRPGPEQASGMVPAICLRTPRQMHLFGHTN